jgi:hypothetical protein
VFASLFGRKVVLVGLLTLAAGLARPAHAATDPRELQARQDFVEGRYQEALDLFARLYAETLHPNYLRNIGRCYQNLHQPDKAITNFRDYLHKAKDVTPAEQQEIEGYIKEMEDLKSQKEAAAPSTTASTTPVTPLPAATDSTTTPAPATSSSVAVVTTDSSAPPPESSPPLYQRWWFWALVVGAVAAGVGVAAAAGAFTKTQDASCPSGFNCP